MSGFAIRPDIDIIIIGIINANGGGNTTLPKIRNSPVVRTGISRIGNNIMTITHETIGRVANSDIIDRTGSGPANHFGLIGHHPGKRSDLIRRLINGFGGKFGDNFTFNLKLIIRNILYGQITGQENPDLTGKPGGNLVRDVPGITIGAGNIISQDNNGVFEVRVIHITEITDF